MDNNSDYEKSLNLYYLVSMLETAFALHVARISLYHNPAYMYGPLSKYLEALIDDVTDYVKLHFRNAGFQAPEHLRNLVMIQKYLAGISVGGHMDLLRPFFRMPLPDNLEEDADFKEAFKEYDAIMKEVAKRRDTSW